MLSGGGQESGGSGDQAWSKVEVCKILYVCGCALYVLVRICSIHSMCSM